MHSSKPADLMLCAAYSTKKSISGPCTNRRQHPGEGLSCPELTGYCRFVSLHILSLLPTARCIFQVLKLQGRSIPDAPQDVSTTIAAVQHQKSSRISALSKSDSCRAPEWKPQIEETLKYLEKKLIVSDVWLWWAKCQHQRKDVYRCGTKWSISSILTMFQHCCCCHAQPSAPQQTVAEVQI